MTRPESNGSDCQGGRHDDRGRCGSPATPGGRFLSAALKSMTGSSFERYLGEALTDEPMIPIRERTGAVPNDPKED